MASGDKGFAKWNPEVSKVIPEDNEELWRLVFQLKSNKLLLEAKLSQLQEGMIALINQLEQQRKKIQKHETENMMLRKENHTLRILNVNLEFSSKDPMYRIPATTQGDVEIRKRIIYDREFLLKFRTSSSKGFALGTHAIPAELLRDGNSSSFNIGPLPRGSRDGNFGRGGHGRGNRNYGQGGARMGNNNIAGPFPNRGMRGVGQGGWGGGAGPFQIPPPAPGPNRAPVFITLKPVELHKDPNAWKPGRNVDETKDKEQILIDEMKKKTRGIQNKLTPENFDKLDHSMTSISPDPIEKYIEITPEKIPVAAISPQFTESGEPSSLANAITTNNKEITVSSASPNFPVRIEDSSPGSSPTNQITNAEDEINKVEKRLEELRITAVEPAQIEPTFTNGGNEIDESVSGDDDMEEGEVHEGESDETGEPIRKRIVYDRDALLNFKTSASKDLVQGIDSIPPELIRDGNSSSFNIGPLPWGSRDRNFGGGGHGRGNRNYGQGGARMGNNNIAGPFPNRGMRGMGQGGWGGGAGPFQIPPPAPGPFQIPPPAPGPNRAPVFITLKPVELHKEPYSLESGGNENKVNDSDVLW